MARADLLLDLVRAGARGDQPRFRKVLEAMIAEERDKQHHVFADRLAENLPHGAPVSPLQPNRKPPSSDLVHQIDPVKRMDELVLPELVRAGCMELIEEQHRVDILRSHNVEPRHRLLVVGPPGNGKTSLAEAIASELSVPLLVVRYESLIASFLGETAVRIATLFSEARRQHCVLFFDEFDVIGKERGDVHETGEIKRAVSSLLLQIDSLPSYVVVVTATNHPELLDRAVWRRFQLRLELPAPTQQQAAQWLRDFERRTSVEFGVSPATIAKRLRPESFAELEQFGLDVQRRYILALPKADVRRIVDERLTQWEQRFTLTNRE